MTLFSEVNNELAWTLQQGQSVREETGNEMENEKMEILSLIASPYFFPNP